jgi:CubicO group peptidase (beta-lactamase class C family)
MTRRPFRAVLLGVFGLLLASCSTAAPARAVADPVLPPALQPFEHEMRGWMDRFGVRRATLAVMREDRLVLARGYGGREAGERVDVWSLSKAVTGACIATLVRDGTLRLEDPIERHLTPLHARHGPFADERVARVTVADLLTHRGGWPRWFTGFTSTMGDILRRLPPRATTADMLLPFILRARLAHEPSTRYEYSNTGYLLLGQVIEARAGERYVRACGRRVLARAGIGDARLDATWGGLLDSAGGWSLSAPEYLAFLRLLRPRTPDFLSPDVRAWLTDGTGKGLGDGGHLAYTLGVNVRLPAGNLFHSGSWTWRQPDGVEGRIAFKEGTWAVLAADGVAWMASFDTVTSSENADAIRALDAALWRARRAVSAWPEGDRFAALGIGPVAPGP